MTFILSPQLLFMVNTVTARTSFRREIINMEIEGAILSENIVTDDNLLTFLQAVNDGETILVDINRSRNTNQTQLSMNTEVGIVGELINAENAIVNAEFLNLMRMVGIGRLNLRIENHTDHLLSS